MKAHKTCVWNGDCFYQNSQQCPLMELEYDENFDYVSLCEYYMTKQSIDGKCPPHIWEKFVLFNIPRYRCKRCGKEK